MSTKTGKGETAVAQDNTPTLEDRVAFLETLAQQHGWYAPVIPPQDDGGK